jgi:hypothetical protein
MPQLIPGIGTTGLYELQSPFQALLLEDTAYTCVAVRKLEDIIAAGADPKAEYYIAHGLTDADYQTDLAAGVCIVSLQAGEGEWVYVPSSKIVRMPDQGGIPYTTIALAVSLGAIPNALDLSYLKTRIAELVTDTVGVATPEVHAVAISPTTNISQTEHQTLEAAREANIAETLTDYAKLQAVTLQRDQLAQKVQELETALANQLGGP